MKNDMTALRDELFATLRALRDPENPMECERARAISEVAKVMTETAKVEVEYMRVTETITGTGFFEQKQETLPPGITAIRQHRIK